MDKYNTMLQYDKRLIHRNRRNNSHLEDYEEVEIDFDALPDKSDNATFLNGEAEVCEEEDVAKILELHNR